MNDEKRIRVTFVVPEDVPVLEALRLPSDLLEEHGYDFIAEAFRREADKLDPDNYVTVPIVEGHAWLDFNRVYSYRYYKTKIHLFAVWSRDSLGRIIKGKSSKAGRMSSIGPGGTALCGNTYEPFLQAGRELSTPFSSQDEPVCSSCLNLAESWLRSPEL